MKMGIKEMNFIHSLVGKRLLNVCCAAEILTFDFFRLLSMLLDMQELSKIAIFWLLL